MKRRDFIKTIGISGISCMGSCFNPFKVLAAGTTSLKSGVGYKALRSTRLNLISTSSAVITSLDDVTYDPEPLLERYDKNKQDRRELYLNIFGENEIDDILDEMRDSYEALIPNITYIGEVNFNLQWYIPNCEKLAEYLVAKDYGVTVKEFSNLHLMNESKKLLTIPEADRIKIGGMQFGFEVEQMIAGWALWSQFQLYPDDYIYRFRKGDGVDFDWGLDYTQCANVIMFKKYNVLDLLVPLVCTMDDLAGSALFTGYHRTMQLATGDPMCDLRWKLQV